MKKIVLALAAFGMATMFTACGDDSSSSGSGKLVSCDAKSEMTFLGETFTTHSCAEIEATSANEKKVEENCVSIEGLVTMTKGSGCASGAKKTCEDKEDGSIMYYYDDDDAEKSCEELLAGVDDDDEEGLDDDEDDLNNGDSDDDSGSDDSDDADASDDSASDAAASDDE